MTGTNNPGSIGIEIFNFPSLLPISGPTEVLEMIVKCLTFLVEIVP